MHGSLRADAFALLRQAMKARGVTFAALARQLDLSEPTVKRVFAERDCKLSRLNAICEVLDVDAADLFDRAERTEATPEALDAATEAALAGDSDLFAVFILMRDDMAPDAIARADRRRCVPLRPRSRGARPCDRAARRTGAAA